MTPERWHRVKILFAEAQERPVAARRSFLEAACAGDDALLAEVTSLLEAATGPSPLDTLADAWVTPLLGSLRQAPREGQRIGPYTIESELGSGGMGVVYKAYDPRLRRHAALKLLPATGAADARARFLDEARAAAALDHPNICTIYEVGEADDGTFFIAMACYEGETLAERLTGGALPIDEVITLGLQVTDGLAQAHAAGVIHRDIKPANLMWTDQGLIKILDFGIAMLNWADTPDGALRAGTVAYMAPEQARGEAVGAGTDLWGLGVVLYEALTGLRPFRGDRDASLVQNIVDSEPIPVHLLRPDVPEALGAIVMRALAKATGERYASAEAMRHDLEALHNSGPPASTLRIPPLPEPLTSFVGRERELRDIDKLLQSTRLLTLTGPGGAGKTRLSLEAGRRAPLEAAFVPLASVSDPDLVLSTIAHTLSVAEVPGRTPLENLTRALSQRPLLLVLDNAEHVTSGMRVVGELLSACPALRLLVTSRTALRLSGERVLPVPPLQVPSAGEADPETLHAYAAVRLFEARAQAARPGFAVTEANADAVALLCRRLDGLPLAIELAAARVQLFSPHAILARLDDRLDLLKDSLVDRPARHQTLRQAIAWSYDLLGAEAQRFFRRLSAFAGGCTLEAAAAVCLGDRPTADALDIVQTLVDHSLLRPVPRSGPEPRFTLLETLRAFAREELQASGEAEALGAGHAAYFLAQAEAADEALAGAGQAAALDRLAADHDNLRAALDSAVARGDAATGLRLGAALWRFWLIRGHIREGAQRLERALALPASDRPELRAPALVGLGTLKHNVGDNPKARTLLEESLALWRVLGHQQGIASALNGLAWVACETSDLATADDLAIEALVLCRRLGDTRGTAVALNNLGWVANYRGDYQAARAYHGESLSLRRAAGDRRGVAFALSNLAWAEIYHGAYDAALALLDEAEELLADVRDYTLTGWAIAMRTSAELAQGRLDEAERLVMLALRVWQESGNRSGLAWTYTDLGRLALARHDLSAAHTHLREALAVWTDIHTTWGSAHARLALGLVAYEEGAFDEARAHCEDSRSVFRRLGALRDEAATLEALALLDYASGAAPTAVRRLATAQALRRAAEAPLPPLHTTRYERLRADLRADLGEASFALVWAEGSTAATEQA